MRPPAIHGLALCAFLGLFGSASAQEALDCRLSCAVGSADPQRHHRRGADPSR